MYVGVFVGLTVIETPLVHWALMGSPVAAWIVTGLQIYGVWWLLSDLRALARGGVIVGDDIELRIGKRWRGRIPRDAVERVERGDAPDKRVDFSILGANVVLVLRRPCVIRGPFGVKRKVDRVALSIDEPDAFSGMVAAFSASG